MRNILFLCFVLLGLSGCALPVYNLNPPEYPEPPRPLDIQNIFFSERVLGSSRQYVGDKVLFLADISTSPYGRQYEAFLADKDGKNLARLSYDGAEQAEWIFDNTRIFIRSTSSLIILDSKTMQEIHRIQNVRQSCSSPDKKQIAFVEKIKNAAENTIKSPYYAVYLLDEKLEKRKIVDLPCQFRPAFYYGIEHMGLGFQEFLDMKWTPDGFYFVTTAVRLGWGDRIQKRYKMNLDGSNLTIIEQ